MNFKDIKRKSETELKEFLAEKRGELHALRGQAASGQLKQVHLIRNARRTIAKILTVMRGKL